MRLRILSAVLLLAAFGTLLARREPRDRFVLPEHEEAAAKRASAWIHERGSPLDATHPEGVERGVDVLSYDLSFAIDPAVVYLEGRAVIRLSGVARSTSRLILDLDGAYTIREATRDGATVAVTRTGATLAVPLDPPLRAEERATLTIAYAGVPPRTYGALSFFQTDSGPAVTSLAEPFGARTFWPCVDDPADRAVVTVRATVPSRYTVASAGLSTVLVEPDGKKTFVWSLPQSIPTYLVSLNVAPYVTIEDRYTASDGREMPIRSYVLPEHRDINIPRVLAIKDHIRTQVSLFGEYPFLDTKYGIVEAFYAGGMEHPTMTSLGTRRLGATSDITILMVHELTHQWWGDRVTMKTWDDIWLNEGFATYGEVLYREKALGDPPGTVLTGGYDDGLYAGALGPTVVASPDNPFGHTGSAYHKGAWTLHMLRRVVGDAAFFEALRAYGDTHAFGTATRQDLRAAFEARTGLDLGQFFDQWLETPYRPILRAAFTNALDASSVSVRLEERQTHSVVHPTARASDVPFYVFPLRIRVVLVDGTRFDRDVVVDAKTKTFSFDNPARKLVSGLVLDPEGDLLKVVESVGAM